jgi:uncharacterized protein (TIGR03032 family)
LQAELFILQVGEFLDVGDGVYRFHTPSRQLSRLPGVVVADCDLQHRLLPALAEAADVLVLAGFDWDMFPLLERRRAAGRVSVFEANDYYYDLQPWNPLSARWLDRALQDSFGQGLTVADAVQTSTPELARRWRERTTRPVAVFVNQLTDVPPLAPPRAGPLTIGWGGSPGHFADWFHIAPFLERWLQAHPDVHLAVMSHEFARPFVSLPPERYRFTPFGSLAEYLEFVRGLDIGLAPLLPSAYNRCRSDVKFLEYASQGVAGIYADLEPYRGCVVHGQTGLLYRTPEDLLAALDLLAGDAALRQRLRQQAHAYVAAQRRLEDHAGERLAFYRGLLAGPARGHTLGDEVLAAAVRDGRYLQLRPQPPEAALRAALAAPASRASVQALERLVQEHPAYLGALQHLGRSLNDLREPAAALGYLERARALDPDSARTLCEIGRAYYHLNDAARARHTLEAALTRNPYYQLGWQYLLGFLRLTGADDGAGWAERAHRLHPAIFPLALLGARLYPPEEAVAVVGRLLEEYAPALLAEERPAAAAAFGEAIREAAVPRLGTPDALAVLRRGCAVFPHSAQLANLLGHALHRTGQHPEAQAEYARALELRRVAQTYRAEYHQEDGAFSFGQFAEHIHSLMAPEGPAGGPPRDSGPGPGPFEGESPASPPPHDSPESTTPAARTTVMTEAQAAPAPAAGDTWLEVTSSRHFAAWLAEQQVSLAFTTYQAGKLFLLGRHPTGQLAVFERTFNRCMGLWGDGQTLWMNSLYQLWRFENALRPGELHQGCDRLYVPRLGCTTGDLDVHDLAVEASGRVVFVATTFGCLATLSERYSFRPLWRPAFLSALAAEDRCHLNGLALEDGRARYVTAVSTSDVADGWRDRRRDGGCVLEVPGSRVVAAGLSMPHSPRVYRDRLWVLNSGTGFLGTVDPARGTFEPRTFCPGYLRGLAFVGDYAVVGLSRPRHDRTFGGLALEEELAKRQADARCGLQVIDLRSGAVAHWVRIEGMVSELYDVATLPGVVRPMALGFKTDEIQRTLAVEDAGVL